MATPPASASPSAEKPESKHTDWERIEAQYRAGIMSLREIADKHGITEGAIRKRAKRDTWERDLNAKVRAKAEALVRKETVRKEVREKGPSPTERETVDIEAGVLARIQLNHRTDIGKARDVGMALLAELEASCGPAQAENLRKLGELMASKSASTKAGAERLLETFQKAISLPNRARIMKDLGESLRVLLLMERKAFGLDQAPVTPPDEDLTDEELDRAIAERTQRAAAV